MSVPLHEILRRLFNPCPQQRMEALREYCERLGDGAIDYFPMDLIDDPEPEVRALFGELMGTKPGLVRRRETRQWLAGMLADSVPVVRRNAVEALRKVDAQLTHKPARGAIILMSLFDSDEQARTSARGLLIEALLRDVASDNPRFRVEAGELLNRLDDSNEPWLAATLELVGDRVPELKDAVRVTSQSMMAPGRGAVFLAALFESAEPARTAARNHIVALLLRDLAKGDLRQQREARELFSRLDDAHNPWLAAALDTIAYSPHYEPDVRDAARDALRFVQRHNVPRWAKLSRSFLGKE